jgi:hypothetical protein
LYELETRWSDFFFYKEASEFFLYELETRWLDFFFHKKQDRILLLVRELESLWLTQNSHTLSKAPLATLPYMCTLFL